MKSKQLVIALILGLILIVPAASASRAVPDRPSAEPATLALEAPAQSALGVAINPVEPRSPPAGECGQLTPLWAPDSLTLPATSQVPDDPQEITVLTYNTHLFGGSLVCTFKPSMCHEDEDRAWKIVERVAASGADIVALQEVWTTVGKNWQGKFVDELEGDYPFGYYANKCTGSIDYIGSGLVLLSKWPLGPKEDRSFSKFPVYNWEAFPSDNDYWATKGVIAATALVGTPPKPIRIGISHAKTGPEDLISQSTKGQVDPPIAGYEDYVGHTVTSFELNGQPYIFALKDLELGDVASTRKHGYVIKIEDYRHNLFSVDDDQNLINDLNQGGQVPNELSKKFEEKGYDLPQNSSITVLKEGSRWTIDNTDYFIWLENGTLNVYKPAGAGRVFNMGYLMSNNYKIAESFEWNGHPYLFVAHDDNNKLFIARINDDPMKDDGITWPKVYEWEDDLIDGLATSFELNGHPYMYMIDERGIGNGTETIVAINVEATNDDDIFRPVWGNHRGNTSDLYEVAESFELDNRPYIFKLKNDGNHKGEALISRVNDDASLSHVKWIPWPGGSDYEGTTITSFQLNGQPYIFGVKDGGGKARITRINPDLSIEHFEFDWKYNYGKQGTGDMDSEAVESFELNGKPYLFALRDCCTGTLNHCAEWRPGQLYIKRIYEEDGTVKIEDINQLDDIRIIRDATVRDDMPAIMMGDFNVHKEKYGIMNEIFAKAGAVDAWVAVHGSGEGGETINICENNLHMYFYCKEHPEDCTEGTPSFCPGTPGSRIDYVYVKDSPTNLPPKVEAGDDQTAYEGDLVSLAPTFDDETSMLTLVPTDAGVIRDWKYDDDNNDDNIPDMDLSDHYPLWARFTLQEQVVTHTATIDWGDGTQDAGLLNLPDGTISGGDAYKIFLPSVTVGTPRSPDSTIFGSHVYADNGVYTVKVCVTDSLGESGCDTLAITVLNVAPSVDAGPDQSADEGIVFDLAADFNDKGTLDTHTATISWGDGNPPEDGLVSEAPFGPPGSTAGADGTVSGSHVYGDDSFFPVTVTVTDDDGDSGSDSSDLTVNNVDPTAEIDDSDAVLVNGVPTFLAHAGESMDFSGRATDPGSDDLFLGWDWDDGSPIVTIEDLVNPPNPDPFPSPDVDPRDVTDMRTHTFSDACLYEISFLVDDDDGGHGEDHAMAIITGNADKARSEGYWQHQYSGKGQIDFDRATLKCYLSIVGHVSTVFNEARDASTIEHAHDVLFLKGNQGSEREKLDRELLVVWLNFANGAIEYLELLDTDKDGVGDTRFSDVVAAAEAVRLDPGATDKELREQTNILHHIKQMSD